MLLTGTIVDNAQQPQVKIIDFGQATLTRFQVNEIRGKPSYQPPEMHSPTQPYDAFLADVFMLGVSIFGMFSCDYPWESTGIKPCQFFDIYRTHGLLPLLQSRPWQVGARPDGTKKG